MKTSDYILFKINRLPKGYVFTYADFITKVNKQEAIIKALNRMASSGKIAKLAKGRFYKPETSTYGNLQPGLYQIVKDLLEDNGKISGYLTGYSIYNRLGLTTQVSSIIQIGKNETRPSFKRERYTISFIKQKNTITKVNVPILQILDSIRYIKKIPDTSNSEAANRLLAILYELTEDQQSSLARLALKYPPAARALTGALLEELDIDDKTGLLKKSLNPITTYQYTGISKTINSFQQWNIKE
jgi:hypothetical protein